jgi:Prokaryotic phospholipase A2
MSLRALAGAGGRTYGHRMRAQDERGQTSAEYLGILVVVVAIVAALAASGIGERIASGIERGVCEIAQLGCEAEPGGEGEPVDPGLTPEERASLLAGPEQAQDVLDSLSDEELAWLRENDPEAAQAAEEAIDWRERRELLDRYLDAPLDEFIDYRDSGDRDDRLDWSTDHCSAPLVGSTGLSFDFTDACIRHDFGYRNSKELGLFDERKDEIDNRFLDDMKDHCSTRSILLQGRCYQWAYTFYYAVRAFG